MSDQLLVQFEYSPVEHVRAYEETPYRRMVAKWWVPGSVAGIALSIAIALARRDIVPGKGGAALLVAVLTALPMLAVALAMPSFMRRFQIARYRRARRNTAKELETRQFGPEGFTPGGDRLQPIPWPMITRVIESDGFYLFYHALSEVPDYVPKRALTGSDAEVMKGLLRQQFRARSGDLQLRAGPT